jgi:hypothetical protein
MCHSRLSGILIKKDSGQARMTAKEENDFGEKGMKK